MHTIDKKYCMNIHMQYCMKLSFHTVLHVRSDAIMFVMVLLYRFLRIGRVCSGCCYCQVVDKNWVWVAEMGYLLFSSDKSSSGRTRGNRQGAEVTPDNRQHPIVEYKGAKWKTEIPFTHRIHVPFVICFDIAKWQKHNNFWSRCCLYRSPLASLSS